MKCIGFSSQPCRRPLLRPLFNHLLLVLIVFLAQCCPFQVMALEPVVNKDGVAQSDLTMGGDSDPSGEAQLDAPAESQAPGSDTTKGDSPADKGEKNSTASRRSAVVEHFNPTDTSFVQRYLKLSEYMPLSEIKPGMEGYGLTVFQGTKVDRFGVKVIGIIRKALSGRDAVLIRISGEKLGKNNVVRGMSGSPIYINGRLIGALSYGFDFSKEPIVGVTPVVDMLDALTFHQEELRKAAPNVSLLKRPPYIEAPASELMLPNKVPVAGGTVRLTPLMAPVSLSGFSPRAQNFLKDKFEDIGLAVASGATGGLDPSLIPKMSPQQLERSINDENDSADHAGVKVCPGSSVAVMLTTGSFSSAATGTATAVFGNKVVAFGHAFMEGGSVSLPLATAYILEILPSLSVSFKLSSPIQVVGSIFADRPWSVGAELGRFASMVPVNISVTDEARGVKKVFHCKVVNHPQLTPDLVTASIMSSLDSTYQSQTPYVVKAETTIDVKDHGLIKRVDRFPAYFSAHSNNADTFARLRFSGDPVSGYVGGIVDRLVSNDFERAKVNSVNVDLTVEGGRKLTRIDRISLDKSVVAPGESVKVNCLMKPYNDKPFVKQITFHIPRDVPDCDLAIAACGGDELEAVRRRMGLNDPSPESLNQIIGKIERKERADNLCAVLALPQQSIAIDGKLLKSPPAHWTKLFFTDRSTKSPSLVRADESYHETADNIIDGSHIIAVTVKRPDKVMSKPIPFSVAAGTAKSADGMNITDQAKKALEIGRKSETTTTPGQAAAAATDAAATAATAVVATPAAVVAKIPSMWSVPSAFPHMRGIQLWRQDSEESFRGAKFDGVVADSWGRLSPGFRELARVLPEMTEDQRIWAGVYLKGNFYYSIGNKVYSWTGAAADAPHLVATTSGLIVPAMAADAAHSLLYFASAPGGQVFAVNASGGEARPVTKLNEGTITCLAVTEAGTLYIGTAGTGRLYQWHPGADKADIVFDSGQAHISTLWYCQRENRLYAGTAEKGCVYSINCGAAKDVLPRAEFESGEHIVTGVAKDSKGNLYVATAGAGKVLRIGHSGQADTVALSEAFYTLYYDSKDDRVYCGDGEGDVTRVEIEPLNDQVYFLPVCHTEQEAVLAVASDGQGRLFCGTANVAQLRSFEIAPSGDPSMSSMVHDGLRKSAWSRLRIGDLYNSDKIPFDRFIKVETRGGETSQPDLSWTPWVVAEPDKEGFVVKTPPTRYLQYKLIWKLASAPAEASLRREFMISRVDVSYLPNNFAPTITSVSAKAGDVLSGKVAVVVTGTDPDADNLSLSLALSSDEGKTWTVVAPDVRSRLSEKDKARAKEKEKAKDKEKNKEKTKEADARPLVGGKETARGAAEKEKKTGEEASRKIENQPGKAPDKAPEIGPDKDPGKKIDKQTDQKVDEAANQTSESDWRPEGKNKLEEGSESKPGADSKSDDEASKKANDKDSDKDKDKDADKNKTSEKEKDKDKSPTREKSKDETAEAAKASESYALSEKITYTLDTKKEKDGPYIMRLVLSDKPSNAVAQESVAAFRAVTIDNGEPLIDSLVVKNAGVGKLSLRLTAHDGISEISDCLYKIDEGDGFALSPADLPLSDATHAVFVADDVQYDKQAKKLTVQVFDRAGNCAKKTVNIP